MIKNLRGENNIGRLRRSLNPGTRSPERFLECESLPRDIARRVSRLGTFRFFFPPHNEVVGYKTEREKERKRRITIVDRDLSTKSVSRACERDDGRMLVCTVITFVNDRERCRSRLTKKKKECVDRYMFWCNFHKYRFYIGLIIHRLSTSLNDTIICIWSKIARNFLDD